jgi:hypothetical protein
MDTIQFLRDKLTPRWEQWRNADDMDCSKAGSGNLAPRPAEPTEADCIAAHGMGVIL